MRPPGLPPAAVRSGDDPWFVAVGFNNTQSYLIGATVVPLIMDRDPTVGDIHRFSADAIERVDLVAGEKKPVRIAIKMSNATGLFQVEEVLMHKLKASPIFQHFEVCALVGGEPPRFYLH